MKKLLIFGTGEIAELANYYFSNDSDYSVEAFCIDDEFKTTNEFCGKEVLSYEDIEKKINPKEFSFFAALSYSSMNRLRANKYLDAKSKGYKIASYISSNATVLNDYNIGEHAFILEDNTIQPFVEIASNVTIWSGNHIGHHGKIFNNCFISSHVVISGKVTVHENCFLGVNATINHNINLSKFSFVASGSLINKNTEEYGVYIGSPARKRDDVKSINLKI